MGTTEKTSDASKLTTGQKINALIFGVKNPRPELKSLPSKKFEVVHLKSNYSIECWYIKTDSAKGTIILFHGFSGEKSSMLDKSDEFNAMGYNTLLVDFMGSGGSEGNKTTLGYYEAEQVKTAFEYLQQKREQPVFLFGTSMGAVAIMKAIHDYKLTPAGIILECPFGSMYKTVCARFNNMNIPSFPMAGLLVFWGGMLNKFWAFYHNPITYAKNISCPTLLLYGAKDEKVSLQETQEIFINLKGPRHLKIFENAGHENYLIHYKKDWTDVVNTFLKKYNGEECSKASFLSKENLNNNSSNNLMKTVNAI